MIELPVMFNPEGTADLAKLGIESKLSKSIVRPVFFLLIDCFHPYIEDEKEYALVFSRGESFVVDYDYETSKRIILTAVTE